MKSLQEFITEAESSEDVYVVYMGDGTMENFYYSEDEAKAKVDELNRQVEVGSSMSNQTASRQPVSSATNMDILKRLSNLERRVFGSQLDGNDNNDSHLL